MENRVGFGTRLRFECSRDDKGMTRIPCCSTGGDVFQRVDYEPTISSDYMQTNQFIHKK